MAAQGGRSRLDSVLKLLLVAFISLLAFSSGVYFGKNISDSDHQLKALEGNSKAIDEASDDSKNLDVKPEDALVDEEVAEISDKYVNGKTQPGQADVIVEEGNSAEKVTHEAASATASTGQKPDLTEVQKVAQRVAQNQNPEEATVPVAEHKATTAPEKRRPASLPKTVGPPAAIAQYTVQIASYPTENDAKLRSAELVKKGFPAYPIEANVKGKTWYRVSVGSFKTKKEASDYRAQLMKQADLNAAIVQPVAARN